MVGSARTKEETRRTSKRNTYVKKSIDTKYIQIDFLDYQTRTEEAREAALIVCEVATEMGEFLSDPDSSNPAPPPPSLDQQASVALDALELEDEDDQG